MGASIASTSGVNEQRAFNFDLCSAMSKANIPLNKLTNQYFKIFWRSIVKDKFPMKVLFEKIM